MMVIDNDFQQMPLRAVSVFRKEPEIVPEDISDDKVFCIRDFFCKQVQNFDMQDAQGMSDIYINTLQKYMSLHCNKINFYEFYKPVFWRQVMGQRKNEDDAMKQEIRLIAQETGAIGSLCRIEQKNMGLFFVLDGVEHAKLKEKLREFQLEVNDVESANVENFLNIYWKRCLEMIYADER